MSVCFINIALLNHVEADPKHFQSVAVPVDVGKVRVTVVAVDHLIHMWPVSGLHMFNDLRSFLMDEKVMDERLVKKIDVSKVSQHVPTNLT